MSQFLFLDGHRIVTTAERLEARILERFPESSLSEVAEELVMLARSTHELSRTLARVWWAPRVLCWLGIVVLGAAVIGAITSLELETSVKGVVEWMQAIESAVNDIVFIGIAAWFLWSMEERAKRRCALRSLHGLRAIAHIIDMHQLTKDPERSANPSIATTRSSPQKRLSPFQLTRYLDYSSEMLALVSKLAALVVQDFPDPIVLGAVKELEDLTSGLSRKVWQKIDIVGRMVRPSLPESL